MIHRWRDKENENTQINNNGSTFNYWIKWHLALNQFYNQVDRHELKVCTCVKEGLCYIVHFVPLVRKIKLRRNTFIHKILI